MLELNLKNRAISQTTVAYNSMAKFGNIYLSATEQGIYQITGFSDHAIEIPVLIKSGIFDLGVSQKKKFRAFYFSGEANGDLKVTIYADGIASEAFNITPDVDCIFDFKITYPTNIKARYWQWQVRVVLTSLRQ